MKIRVILVDDEKPARARLRRMLEGQEDFEVVGEAADASAAVALLDRERPDLCFLDIQMPEGDGFDVLRRAQHVPRVVFTTAHDEYAVRAFEVNSLDYLLKPFSKQRFVAALDRVREAMRQDQDPGDDLRRILAELRSPPRDAPSVPPARITARRGAKILLLAPESVLWFEAEETVVFARTREGRVLVDRTLSDLETLLAPGFFRSHRGYLINLSCVAEILPGDAGTYSIVMNDDAKSRVPLSRRQAQRLREIIPW